MVSAIFAGSFDPHSQHLKCRPTICTQLFNVFGVVASMGLDQNMYMFAHNTMIISPSKFYNTVFIVIATFVPISAHPSYFEV